MDEAPQDRGELFEATAFLSYFNDLEDIRVAGAKPRAVG